MPLDIDVGGSLVFEHPTCWGCQTGQPNQLAHMEVGGCLYMGSDFGEVEEEADGAGAKAGLACMEAVKGGRVRRKPKRYGEGK